MFIAHLKNGKSITEKDCCWDEVPQGLTNLELALPLKIGEIRYAPRIILGKYDAYYFFNEAVAVAGGQGGLVAKVIGGIDYTKKECVQMRVDGKGNVFVERFPLDTLRIVKTAIRKAA